MLERPSRFGDKAVFSEQEAIEYERDLVGTLEGSLRRARGDDHRRAEPGVAGARHGRAGAAHLADRRSGNGKVPLKPEVRARAQARAAELDATPGRRSGSADAVRALPDRIGRAADDAAGLQPEPADRADARSRADRHRDDPRRAGRAHERRAPAAGDPSVDGRFGRPLGRRHAGRRHDQLHRTRRGGGSRARACTSWSASRRSPAPRSATTSRSRTRPPTRQPWSGTPLDHAHDERRCTNTPATRGTTRWWESCAAREPTKEETAENAETAERNIFGSACFAISAVFSYPENPIQRPPAPTPNHSASDTSATSFITSGGTRPSPASVTFRRTVSAKIVPSSRQIIFTANGVL